MKSAEPERLVEVYFNNGKPPSSEPTEVSRVRQVQIARLHVED